MNPLLEKIVQDVTAKVPPEEQEAFQRTVLAGKKIMFDKSTHANMELVRNPESRNDPVNTIANGIAGLMQVMYIQSKRSLSVTVVVLAGVVLMAEAMDFAERSFGVVVDNQMVAETTKLLMELVFKKLNISPEQLNEAIAKGKAEIDAGGTEQEAPEQELAQEQQQAAQGPSGGFMGAIGGA